MNKKTCLCFQQPVFPAHSADVYEMLPHFEILVHVFFLNIFFTKPVINNLGKSCFLMLFLTVQKIICVTLEPFIHIFYKYAPISESFVCRVQVTSHARVKHEDSVNHDSDTYWTLLKLHVGEERETFIAFILKLELNYLTQLHINLMMCRMSPGIFIVSTANSANCHLNSSWSRNLCFPGRI